MLKGEAEGGDFAASGVPAGPGPLGGRGDPESVATTRRSALVSGPWYWYYSCLPALGRNFDF